MHGFFHPFRAAVKTITPNLILWYKPQSDMQLHSSSHGGALPRKLKEILLFLKQGMSVFSFPHMHLLPQQLVSSGLLSSPQLRLFFKCTKFATLPHDLGIKPAHRAGKEFTDGSLASGTNFLTIMLRDSPAPSFASHSHGMIWHARSLGWQAQERSEHELLDSSFMYTQKVS